VPHQRRVWCQRGAERRSGHFRVRCDDLILVRLAAVQRRRHSNRHFQCGHDARSRTFDFAMARLAGTEVRRRGWICVFLDCVGDSFHRVGSHRYPAGVQVTLRTDQFADHDERREQDVRGLEEDDQVLHARALREAAAPHGPQRYARSL
jgi:hypothetical protein